jgi:hypothetical protein
LNDYPDWPYLGQVFELERRFTILATGEEEYFDLIHAADYEGLFTEKFSLFSICSAWGGEVPELEVFAGASHPQTPPIRVFSPTRE